MRHDLPAALSLSVAGVLAGCRSLTAIWEHTTDLTAADLEALGLPEGQALPSESTTRRVLQVLDPADLDAHLMTWFYKRTGTIKGRRVIAVDGKTMRAARRGEDPAPHLLAALGHATGAVLSQQRVAGKSNEILALRVLLEPLDPGGVVVPADAMHTQVDTVQWIRVRGGHYVLTPLDNQKTLRRTLKALPWKDVPSISSVERSHGWRVRRTVKAVEAPKWVDFPGSAPVVQVRRSRTVKGRKASSRSVEVVNLVCSLPMTDAQPEAVAASATAVYLDLKTLTSLADSAAAAGADSVEAHPYYGGGATDDAPGSLTDAGVGSKAAEDLSAQPAVDRLEGVTIVSARAADNRTAVVTLRARSRPPFLPWGILPAEGFTITATGSARMTTTQ